MYNFILASASPRRKEILSLLDIPFQVITSDADETVSPELKPNEVVETLSLRKAKAVLSTLANHENTVIISADTIVVHNNKILGKPKDKEDAFHILSSLSGDVHYVYTGITVIADKITTVSLSSKVFFSPLSDKEILDYIETGEPMDKAGAYGIQGKGGKFIEKIDGDYYNIVGLPLNMLYSLLKPYL
ncbi:MAG: septum formation inhibitor Maf [Firmicutes bacterium]|nr:septum formation inhibitor Maf [Bacillota bacterium]